MNRVVSYSVGLILALILTAAAFSLVIAHATNHADVLPMALLIPAILTLAMAQLATQLIFFLHLGQSKESQWNAVFFGFTFFGILVVVIASIWIMNHLNYNMTPLQINQYIESQSGI